MSDSAGHSLEKTSLIFSLNNSSFKKILINNNNDGDVELDKSYVCGEKYLVCNLNLSASPKLQNLVVESRN